MQSILLEGCSPFAYLRIFGAIQLLTLKNKLVHAVNRQLQLRR